MVNLVLLKSKEGISICPALKRAQNIDYEVYLYYIRGALLIFENCTIFEGT